MARGKHTKRARLRRESQAQAAAELRRHREEEARCAAEEARAKAERDVAEVEALLPEIERAEAEAEVVMAPVLAEWSEKVEALRAEVEELEARDAKRTRRLDRRLMAFAIPERIAILEAAVGRGMQNPASEKLPGDAVRTIERARGERRSTRRDDAMLEGLLIRADAAEKAKHPQKRAVVAGARFADDVVAAGRSAYAAVWLVIAKRIRWETDVERVGWLRRLQRQLASAHMICFPPGQVAALPAPETPADIGDVRAPFPTVFLACGDCYDGWARDALYAALMQDDGDRRVCTSFHRKADAGFCDLPMGEAIVSPDGSWEVRTLPWAAPNEDEQDALRLVLGEAASRSLSALYLLESANVELVEAADAPRGHRAAGVPSHEVVIAQSKTRYRPREFHDHPDWSHRWEVRGHYKHFRCGRIFESHYDRRVVRPDGDEFVRIWCPPHVKGPEGKPLVPKVRRYAGSAS